MQPVAVGVKREACRNGVLLAWRVLHGEEGVVEVERPAWVIDVPVEGERNEWPLARGVEQHQSADAKLRLLREFEHPHRCRHAAYSLHAPCAGFGGDVAKGDDRLFEEQGVEHDVGVRLEGVVLFVPHHQFAGYTAYLFVVVFISSRQTDVQRAAHLVEVACAQPGAYVLVNVSRNRLVLLLDVHVVVLRGGAEDFRVDVPPQRNGLCVGAGAQDEGCYDG